MKKARGYADKSDNDNNDAASNTDTDTGNATTNSILEGAKKLAETGTPAKRLVLVGTAAGFVEGARSYQTEAVAADTLVIHGDKDETVHLANVLAWAEPLNLPVVVVPGADHFFHRRLHLIREIIIRAWR